MKTLTEIRARLRELETQREETLNELERSLQIKDLWGDAFKYGACRSGVRGSISQGFIFVITRGDDSAREFNLLMVPRGLIAGFLDNADRYTRRALPRELFK